MPLLEVRNLSVRYDKAQILNGLSLEVAEGEFIGVVGPNGAGKSTLLRAISGLVGFERRMKRGTDGDIALEGEVRFAGERIDALPAHEMRRRLASRHASARNSSPRSRASMPRACQCCLSSRRWRRCSAWPRATTCFRRAASSRKAAAPH